MRNRNTDMVLPVFLVWTIFASAAFGQTNDSCAGAIALFSGVTDTVSTLNATSTNNPPTDCNGYPIGHGVWYTVTTPAYDVRLNLSTCGSSYNTELLVYAGVCGSLGSAVACSTGNNPFGCSSENAGLSFSAPANTTYYILAAGAYSQSGTLNIVAYLSTPPTNDMCANAIPLTNGVADVTNTFDATEFGDPPTDCNGYPIGHGVWYTVTTPAYDVRLNLSTCGSSYNTELLVYAGVCGSLGSAVACSTGNNPFGCSSENAGLSFSAPANTTYYILAAGAYSQSGTLNIVANLSTPPTNDMCANAIPLTNGVADVTNTFDATEFGDPPTDCNGYPIGHGVWYTVTTPAYDVRLNLSTCGSSYNTELLVYAGVCGSLGSAVACSTGNNPFGCSSENAGLSFSAPANTTYYILAAGAYSQSGTLNIVANLSTPPTNDMCANAIPLTNGVTDVTNTFDATEFGDPPTDCNGYPIGHGVWYTVTTPAYDVRLNLSTCGSSYNTELLVYAGVCGSLGSAVACSTGNNPFGCSSENAGLSFSAPANTTYYILAAGAYSQSGTLNIVANLSTPPTNDMCANAIPLTNGVADVTNTFDATEFGDPPTDCNGYPIGHGVWYTVTTPAYDVRLNLSTCGSSYNTELLVYAGVCGSLGSAVACSTGNNPFGCSSENAGLSFSAPANTTYYILAAGAYSQSGTLNIVANLSTPPTNDMCANAIPLTNGVADVTNTFDATEFGDPPTDCNGYPIGHGVWYTVTTPAYDVRLNLSTCGSSYNTELLVYAGVCGSLGSAVACSTGNNPFGCSSENAGLSFSAPANTTYYILAAGAYSQSGTLNIVANLSTPPTNDMCANAIPLTNGVTDVTNTFDATEFGDPPTDCNGYPIGHGVWYTVTTPAYDVRLNLSTCGSSYNTELLVYAGVCGSLGSAVACSTGNNPFGCSSENAGLSFSAPANTTYYILAAGAYSQSGTLNIVANLSTPPTNDMCANAIPLTNGVADVTNTFDATEFGDPPTDCNGYPIGHGVWYTVTTPAYDVRLNLSTCGSSYNTELLVYAGVCGSLGSAVACSTGNNPFGCSSENAGLSFSAPANTTYYILAAGAYSQSGTLNIVANLSTPPTNDMCANAIPLTNGVADVTNTFDATEFGDPPTDCNGYPIGHGVWYTVTTPAYDVRLNLSTCGSSYNTELLVYAGVCGSLGSAVACSTGNNPFGCSSENAGLSFSAPANTTYYILAAGAYSQSGTLNIVANLSTPPTNDMCANAIPLTNGVTDVTNTFDATEFGDPPTDCNGYPIGHGVWYTVTTPAYDVRLNLSTCGSSYNTELLVYAGVCGSLGSAVACSTGNNPFGCSSENAGLSFSAPANTTYYILAAGAYSQSGTLNIVANLSTPPTNDMCANAIPLTNGVTDVTNTFDATEFGDPATDCNGYPIGHGVWYTLAAFSGQPITISTCGSSYNTELLVYTNGCGSLGKAVACSTGNNPFGCSGENAGLSFSAPATTTYYILVAGAYSQSGALNIVATVPPPPNDTCAGAFAMTPSINYHVNTISATTNGDPVPSCQDSFGNGVWYTITPAVTERLDISTCGSDFGTVMAIYTGACGALTPYRCSDCTSPTCPNEADINFIATGGVKYYILVGGFNDSGGNLQIAANVVLPPMISNISPKIGLTNGGTVVNLSGTGFESGASVSFGSLSASSITVSGGTNIAAVTPPSVAGPVNVVVSNPDGDMVTVTNGFTFIAPPVIQVQPINQTVVDGSNVQFQVQVGGSAPFMYQWYFNAGIMTDNTRITGSQSNVLTLTSVTMSNAGAYLVHVSNAYGSVTSALASLTVIQAIPIVTWSTPAPIDFGVALSTNQLNAAANVPGSFAYNPTLGTLLPAGTNTLSVIFTPTDTVDYTSVTNSVSLVVVPVCDPPPSGLISWWRAEGNANDFIGGNNGILVSGVTFAPGEVGQAFCFNGANQYVQVADSPTLRLTNGLTLECWFNSSNNYGNLIGKPVGSGYNDSYTIWLQSGALQGKICNAGSQGPGLALAFNSVPGVWYHAAYTYDPIAQQQALYLNGQLVASGAETTLVGYDSHPVQIGADNDNGGSDLFWDGQIDEPSIYDRALSATEIQAIYNAGSAGKCEGGAPPDILTPPANQLALLGGTIVFSVLANGASPLSYQWLFNSANLTDDGRITGSQSNVLTLISVTMTNSGAYEVVVTNNYGSTNAAAILIVQAVPTVTWTNPAAITYGTALSSNQLDATANVPGSFIYNPANGTVLNAGTNTLSVVFTTSGTLDFIKVTNTVSLTVIPLPVIQTVQQSGGSFTFTWSATTGQMYQIQTASSLYPSNWKTLAGTTITATNSTAAISEPIITTNKSQFYRVVLLQ